jgi:hypothetical protein
MVFGEWFLWVLMVFLVDFLGNGFWGMVFCVISFTVEMVLELFRFLL